MPRVYRAMTEVNGAPQVGPTARTLGVRIPADIPVNSGGFVHPGKTETLDLYQDDLAATRDRWMIDEE
jgi:hypothetical protein